MTIRRNDPCPCQSGRKLKHCCLEEHLAWARAGNGIMVAYVERGGGVRYPIADWGAPLDSHSELVLQFNPVTSAWAYRALPDVNDFGTVAYQDELVEHLLRLAGGELTADVAQHLAYELCEGREHLTYEFTVVPAAMA